MSDAPVVDADNETGPEITREMFISMLKDQDKNTPVITYKDAPPELKQMMDRFLNALDEVHHSTSDESAARADYSKHYGHLMEISRGMAAGLQAIGDKTVSAAAEGSVDQAAGAKMISSKSAKTVGQSLQHAVHLGVAGQAVASDMNRAFEKASSIFHVRNEERGTMMNVYGSGALKQLSGLPDVFFDQVRPLYHYSVPQTGDIVPEESVETLRDIWLKATDNGRKDLTDHRAWNKMLATLGYALEDKDTFTPKKREDIFGQNGLVRDRVVWESSLGEYVYAPQMGEITESVLSLRMDDFKEGRDPKNFEGMTPEEKDAACKKMGDERFDAMRNPAALLKSRLDALQETAIWLGMREEVDRRFKEDYIPAAEVMNDPAHLKSVQEGHQFIMKRIDHIEILQMQAHMAGDRLAAFLGHREPESVSASPKAAVPALK